MFPMTPLQSWGLIGMLVLIVLGLIWLLAPPLPAPAEQSTDKPPVDDVEDQDETEMRPQLTLLPSLQEEKTETAPRLRLISNPDVSRSCIRDSAPDVDPRTDWLAIWKDVI